MDKYTIMKYNFKVNTIKIVIGLGNDAKEYLHTYHNLGFLAIDYLKQHKNGTRFENVPLAKTDGFMNAAGDSVRAILKSHEVKPGGLLLIHDDSDIALGNYKFSFGRGSAGHKGVESVMQCLGTKEFWRLRIGIRKQGEERKALDLVLTPMTQRDREILEEVLERLLTDTTISF